jgi:hypothetical protein
VDTFLMMLGAYLTGWVLCNVFLYQVVNRVDSRYRQRQREEFADLVALKVGEAIIEAIKAADEAEVRQSAAKVDTGGL